MNFTNLEYFMVAAEEMNFSRAAKRLFITQQALSKHIHKLEQHYGITLFDRTPPLTLTAAGQCLFENTQVILNMKREGDRKLQDIKDDRNGDLTIGVSYYRGNVMLPKILKQLSEQFPGTHFHLSEGMLSSVTEDLYQGKLDLMIGYQMPASRSVTSVPLYTEYCIIAVPKQIFQTCFTQEQREALLKQDRCSLSEFQHCPFIAMKPLTWMGATLEAYCRLQHIQLNTVVTLQNIRTAVDLCITGVGITVCPSIYIEKHDLHGSAPDVLQFKLAYEPAHKTIAINYLKHKYQTKITKEFIRLARKIFTAQGEL